MPEAANPRPKLISNPQPRAVSAKANFLSSTFRVFLFVVLLVGILGFSGCEKDLPVPDGAATLTEQSTDASGGAVQFTEKDLQPTRTVLGDLRKNPFEVDRLTQAKQLLYGERAGRVPSTHLYVRFDPQSADDLAALAESDLVLFDFPMHYKVEQMGDYYHEPTSETDFPDLYTVIPYGYETPDVTYEIIEQLNLDEADPAVMRKAFELTDNADEIATRYPEDFLGGTVTTFSLEGDCQPDCPGYPCCLTGLVGCEDDYTVPECRGVTGDCYPGHPNYPGCLTGGGGSGGGNSGLVENSCGCKVYANPRMPGGCIKVEDTRLGLRGVRKIKVIVWDGWFDVDRTYTDDEGCWKLREEQRGGTFFWAQFENGERKVRGGRFGRRGSIRLWESFVTVQDYMGRLGGPPYNNINTVYGMWAEQHSKAHRYWGAAHLVNAYEEFNTYAGGISIGGLPRLDIWMMTNRDDGFALMSNYLPNDALSNILGSAYAPIVVTEEDEAFHALLTLGIGLGGSVVYPLAPDVMVGANFTESDNFSRLAFHELAHTSHFPRLGPSNWEALAYAEILAERQTGFAWGLATSTNAGLIAIAESWAEHVARVFAHEKYGENVSGVNVPDFKVNLEETRNVTVGHIPIGIYLDLFDAGAEPAFSRDRRGGGGAVTDAVSGVSYASLYSLFTPTVTSPAVLKDRILNTIVPGSTTVTSTQVNDLFTSYGY